MELASFDFNNPDTLAPFATDDEDEDEALSITTSSASLLDEDIGSAASEATRFVFTRHKFSYFLILRRDCALLPYHVR